MMSTTKKYYAVKSGHVPGVYHTWESCKQQVVGFKANQYKSFPTLAEAEQYLNSSGSSSIKAESTKVSLSVPVKREKNGDRSHKIFSPVKEIQKTSRGRDPLEKSSLLLRSYMLDMLETDGSQVSAVDLKTTGKTDSVQASQSLAQLGSVDVCVDPNVVYRLEYDGASKGNPGHAGAGALLRHPDGSVVCEIAVGLGKTTNNVAEYRGLIAGLKKARELGIQRIEAQGDSKLVTQQLRGLWAVKNENLAVLCKEAKQMVESFKDFKIRHVDREWNSAADALANKGVGLPGFPGGSLMKGICAFETGEVCERISAVEITRYDEDADAEYELLGWLPVEDERRSAQQQCLDVLISALRDRLNNF